MINRENTHGFHRSRSRSRDRQRRHSPDRRDRRRYDDHRHSKSDQRHEPQRKEAEPSIPKDIPRAPVPVEEEFKPTRVPLSVEELIAKKKQEEEEMSRPKFLTKEERAKLALERRQKEVEAKRQRDNEARQAALANGAIMNQHSSSSSAKPQAAASESNHLTNEELQNIRERYVGAEKVKRKIRKTTEQKYVFNWDAEEDTTQTTDVLYRKQPTTLLFGRGKVAGVDPKEQKRQADKFYGDFLSKRRTQDEMDREKYVYWLLPLSKISCAAHLFLHLFIEILWNPSAGKNVRLPGMNVIGPISHLKR